MGAAAAFVARSVEIVRMRAANRARRGASISGFSIGSMGEVARRGGSPAILDGGERERHLSHADRFLSVSQQVCLTRPDPPRRRATMHQNTVRAATHLPDAVLHDA